MAHFEAPRCQPYRSRTSYTTGRGTDGGLIRNDDISCDPNVNARLGPIDVSPGHRFNGREIDHQVATPDDYRATAGDRATAGATRAERSIAAERDLAQTGESVHLRRPQRLRWMESYFT